MSLIACKDVKREYYPNGKIKYVVEVKDEKKEGEFMKYYPSGILEMEGTFLNDKREGIFKSYFGSGVLKSEGFYKNGLGSGLMKEYYENGKLKLSSEVINGKQNGISKSYFENGKLNNECEFKNGITNGFYKEYFINGKLRMFALRNNDTTTYYEEYDENGILVNEYREIKIKAPNAIKLGDEFIAKISSSGPVSNYDFVKILISTNNFSVGIEKNPNNIYSIYQIGNPQKNFLNINDKMGNSIYYKEIKEIQEIVTMNGIGIFKFKPDKVGDYILIGQYSVVHKNRNSNNKQTGKIYQFRLVFHTGASVSRI